MKNKKNKSSTISRDRPDIGDFLERIGFLQDELIEAHKILKLQRAVTKDLLLLYNPNLSPSINYKMVKQFEQFQKALKKYNKPME